MWNSEDLHSIGSYIVKIQAIDSFDVFLIDIVFFFKQIREVTACFSRGKTLKKSLKKGVWYEAHKITEYKAPGYASVQLLDFLVKPFQVFVW